MFGKKPSELTLEQLKKVKIFTLYFLMGLCILWVIILSYMYNNKQPFAVFIGVAVATMVPNFINILNISNEIKKREKNL